MGKLFRLLVILLVISSLALSLAACAASVEKTMPLILTVTSPQAGATVTASPVTVSGTVNKKSTVKVNDVVATITALKFSTSVTLKEGTNEITVVATAARSSKDGEETVTRTLTITYAPAKK